MKKNLLWSVMLLMAGATVMTSCNKDSHTQEPDGPPEDGNVAIRIFDSQIKSRAYNDHEPAVTGETELASSVAVFAYDANGALDYSNLGLTVDPATGVTRQFKVSPGLKYFYVFSNSQVKMPTQQGFEGLEKQVAYIESFTGDVPRPIGVSGRMSIGTLWRVDGDPIDVQGNGYGGEPVKVQADVGRAVAKVRVAEINQTSAGKPSNLPGTFTDFTYRLRSIPDRYYIVGQVDPASNYPHQSVTGVRHISAVHEEGPGTDAFPSDVYVDYTWTGAKTPSMTDHFYAVENTSKKLVSENSSVENLYYGNTTYVQFQGTYAPTAAEISDVTNPGTPGTAINPGDDFWTGVFNGTRYIFGVDPTSNSAISDIKHYEKGVVYYKFPVRDKNETGVEFQCRVLRNHYYEIYVDSIKDLGEPTDEVDRETPIDEDDPNVEITVKVLDWYKVETHEDV